MSSEIARHLADAVEAMGRRAGATLAHQHAWASTLDVPALQALADVAMPTHDPARRKVTMGQRSQLLSELERRQVVEQRIDAAVDRPRPEPRTLAQVYDLVTWRPDRGPVVVAHPPPSDEEIARHDCESCQTSLLDCDAMVTGADRNREGFATDGRQACCHACAYSDTHNDPTMRALGGIEARLKLWEARQSG